MEVKLEELTDIHGNRPNVRYPDNHGEAYSVWLGDFVVGIGGDIEEAIDDALEAAHGLLQLRAS